MDEKHRDRTTQAERGQDERVRALVGKDYRLSYTECGHVEREFYSGAWVCDRLYEHGGQHHFVWRIETAEQRQTAERIHRENYALDVATGQNYRCIYCQKEAPAGEWTEADICPKCGKSYDTQAAMLAQEGDDG